MAGTGMRRLRSIADPFLAPAPTGVSVRDRLKGLTPRDEAVLEAVGAHLGSLASTDLAARCADGTGHGKDSWAARKRQLTPQSSSRWAGAITRASNEQWALARRSQAAHLHRLQAGIDTLRHRLSQPLGARGSQGAPGGYACRWEWHAKSRRLAALEHRHAAAVADWEAGRVRVVRGGKRLLNTRHHLDQAGLTQAQWQSRWEAARFFLSADGESGKRHGNETIRITPEGQVSIRLPAPLAHLANAAHGRYVLSGRVVFAHRGAEWADRVEADGAVAYRIHLDTARDPGQGRWYVSASWTPQAVPALPLQAALARGVVGVDANADHLAAWRLDVHGNPTGNARRFAFDLSGSASHRDAQVRHALSRLLRWATTSGVRAIAVEDLDFAREKSREKYGRRKKFRQLISGFPTARLRSRLVSMAHALGVAVITVDPAYTSRWGAQHWQQPLSTKRRKVSRHDAASIAVGRRAQGHPVRRRTAPPPHHRSDGVGHRTAQAAPGSSGREGNRPPVTERARDARGRTGQERGDPAHPAPFGMGAVPAWPPGVTSDHCSGTVPRR
ncbi:IS200/IS605 family accessory protein TnpB-related protein [Nocardiopsis dassonvillei]|uniref:IS200/IS605 family accessory protein TnpB-related protein n=1 Tax=Nocardiopsis dassonvillei TaxID=2014 RepID=UPI00200EEFDD|nr:IS200/IS605 family accessory protein TnpB-related protein [Nocardiopsis dassonvillei]MCK9873843.1 IS200/IS605 family accessory protein TnpB-related protein [Nocardiopsis dassonvillei]